MGALKGREVLWVFGLGIDMHSPPHSPSADALGPYLLIITYLPKHIFHLKKFLKSKESGDLVPWAQLAPACRWCSAAAISSDTGCPWTHCHPLGKQAWSWEPWHRVEQAYYV